MHSKRRGYAAPSCARERIPEDDCPVSRPAGDGVHCRQADEGVHEVRVPAHLEPLRAREDVPHAHGAREAACALTKGLLLQEQERVEHWYKVRTRVEDPVAL